MSAVDCGELVSLSVYSDGDKAVEAFRKLTHLPPDTFVPDDYAIRSVGSTTVELWMREVV
jgi:hypothetical protein